MKFKHSFAWQDDFKSKSCQLQCFITFRDLQSLFWLFFIRGRLKSSNFKFLKFKHSFAWQDDFKLKSCQLQSFITFRDIQSLFWLFSHLFIRHGHSNIVHKSYILSCSFINYKRDMLDLWTNLLSLCHMKKRPKQTLYILMSYTTL